jgi:hypothetical protein
MKMKSNLVLNQTGSKFFVKFSEDFRNSKNYSQDQTGASIKFLLKDILS